MFKLGDRVFDIRYGWGVVVGILDTGSFPILVKFGDQEESYTLKGCNYSTELRSLYHHDYTPTEQLPLKSSPELLREKFAGMAMNSILNTEYSRWFFNEDSEQTSDEIYDNIALMSVCMADALIKALNEKP